MAGTGTVAAGLGGWYQPTVVLVDSRGCENPISVPATQVAGYSASPTLPLKFEEKVRLARPVASAELSISYNESSFETTDASDIQKTEVLRERRVVDSSLHPPSNPIDVCGGGKPETRAQRRARLREQAKTDPEGADAAAISDMSRNEVVATAINTAGFLCARVTDMYPSGGAIIVNCVEYRNGSGRAKYRVDASAGRVEEIG